MTLDPRQAPAPHARLAASWRRYLRFWRPRVDADVDDEFRFHFDMRVRDHMANGMTELEARAAVLQRLGDIASTRAECVAIAHRREQRMTRVLFLDSIYQDVRYAFRTFARQKAWTTVAIVTLTLGIGANTAVFSVVNTLILHPVPYPNADRISLVWLEPIAGTEGTRVIVSIAPHSRAIESWQAGAHSFERLEAYSTTDVTVARRGAAPTTFHAAYIQPSFPGFAGKRVLVGRMFSTAEVRTKLLVALLAEPTWRTQFGADPGVIGQSLEINDKLYTIIGVLPASLALPRRDEASADVWLPLQLSPGTGTSVIGRLRRGVSSVAAARELDTLLVRAAAVTHEHANFRTKLMAPVDLVPFKHSLTLLMAAVAVVLLIACVNVAHLLLARSVERQRELAIRMSLGARRGRLFGQLVTESLALTAAGSAGGLLIGWAGLRAVIAASPQRLSILSAVRLDGSVLAVALALSIITGIGVGLAAAIHAARHSTHESLKTGSMTTSQSRRHYRLRSLLVVSEMALTGTLVVGASLLVRTVIHLHVMNPGFEPRGLYSIRADLPQSRYRDPTAKKAFYADLIERTIKLPGVVKVADATPPGYNFMIGALQAEGEAPPSAGTTAFLKINAVSPSYFDTMRLPIVEGRIFSDTTATSTEIMVNEGFAKKHWLDNSAVGRRVKLLRFDGTGEWSTIVGIVKDASTGGLTDVGTDPMLYAPTPSYQYSGVLVRVQPGRDALPALRSIVSSLDPRLPPPMLTNIEQAMAASAAEPRLTMILLVVFTGLALVLAAIGLFGVMAYTVAQRTREIGIRIALGATRTDMSRDVVLRGVVLAATGAAIGMTGAWWATKVVEKMLYGVTRTDPVSFAVGAAVLLVTAIAACIVPMHRAASVDPVIAMRAE